MYESKFTQPMLSAYGASGRRARRPRRCCAYSSTRGTPVLVGQSEVLGSLLPLLAGELLQIHEARLGVALEPHNPSEGAEVVAVDGDDLSQLDGAVDILAARPDEAVRVGVEGVDVDAWFVEAHRASLSW